MHQRPRCPAGIPDIHCHTVVGNGVQSGVQLSRSIFACGDEVLSGINEIWAEHHGVVTGMTDSETDVGQGGAVETGGGD